MILAEVDNIFRMVFPMEKKDVNVVLKYIQDIIKLWLIITALNSVLKYKARPMMILVLTRGRVQI